MPAFKKVKKSTGGKPIEITQELIDNVCNAMRAGAYIETAAAFAGIHKDTLHTWLKKGREKPKSTYGKLISAVDKAMADCVMRDLLNIDKCAMGQEWEYERYPEGSVDDEGFDISGNLILRGRNNPIVKKIGLAPDWTASAWRLERRHSGHWSRIQKLEVDDPRDTPPETEEQKQERLERIAEKMKKLQALNE